MKVLKVLGVLVVLGIIVVVAGGYWAYKKGGAKMVTAVEQEVEKFITDKQIPETEASSMRRLLAAAKSENSMTAVILVSVVAKATEDQVISSEEVSLMDEGTELAEQDAFTKETMQSYMTKVNQVMPSKQ